jgi:uncharacterized membrane protein
LTQVFDGELHRYVANIDGVPIRFLLVQKPDGKVAAMYDACEICGAVGFYRTKSEVICKNCAAPINPASLGQPGGCNPIPLKAATTN